MQYMPHVSRIRLNQQSEKKILDALQLVLTKLTNEKEMDDFLISLMTPTERLMFAKRLAAVILLKENLPDMHISSTLKITRETVSRIRMLLEIRGRGYDNALGKLQNEKIMQELKGALKSLASYAVKAAGGRL